MPGASAGNSHILTCGRYCTEVLRHSLKGIKEWQPAGRVDRGVLWGRRGSREYPQIIHRWKFLRWQIGKSWFLIIHLRVLFYLQVCSYGQINMQMRKTASFRADIRGSWAPLKYSQNVCQISSVEAIGDSLLQGMDAPSADLIWCLGSAAHWAVEFRIPQKDYWGLSELLIPLGSSDSARGVLKHSWMIAWPSWWGCRAWGSQVVSRQAGGAACAGSTKASSILYGVKGGRARRWGTQEFIPL